MQGISDIRGHTELGLKHFQGEARLLQEKPAKSNGHIYITVLLNRRTAPIQT